MLIKILLAICLLAIAVLARYAKRLARKIFTLEKKVSAIETKIAQNFIPSTKEDTQPDGAAVEIKPAAAQAGNSAAEAALNLWAQPESMAAEAALNLWAQPERMAAESARKQAAQAEHSVAEPSVKRGAQALTQEPIDTIIDKLKVYFTTGNPLLKIGGIILFFGLSFLIQFAVNNDMISVEFGLLSALITSVILTFTGFKYRRRQGAFGLILQGIGIAIFYLVIFSAAKFFSIITFSIALSIMVLAVILATILAIIQNAFYLAAFATSGGFLAPILTSTGEGSHIILFSYYTLLNFGILAVAWYKSWRVLNLIGFVFTFLIASVWGFTRYNPEYFATTEPFVILFFLLYVAIAVLFAHKRSFKLKAYVDSVLVFGTPIIAFGMQASLGENIEYFLAYSAFGAGSIYILLAWWLRTKPTFSLLRESFLALGIVFLSLVFAFALAPKTYAVIYALESSAIIWVSLRQNRLYARIFALFMLIYAIVTFIADIKYMNSSRLFFNEVYLGLLILSVASFLITYIYDKYKENVLFIENYIRVFLLMIGLLIFFLAGFREIYYYTELISLDFISLLLIYLSLSVIMFMLVALYYKWQTMKNHIGFFFPLSLLLVWINLEDLPHPFFGVNTLAMPLFIFTHYLLLSKIEFYFSRYWHAIGLWVSIIVLSWELFYHVEKYSYIIAFALLPLLAIIAIYIILKHAKFWPLSDKVYKSLAINGLVVMLLLWEFIAVNYSGQFLDFAYIPFVNPLDFMQLLVVVALIFWLRNKGFESALILRFAGVAGIILISTFWARFVHAYEDIPYSIIILLMSAYFQTGISIIYTLIALAIIIYAQRGQDRSVWFTGAALLGFVILKLFINDIGQHNSLERIISFLVVGVLILLVGFIAPLPPKQVRANQSELRPLH